MIDEEDTAPLHVPPELFNDMQALFDKYNYDIRDASFAAALAAVYMWSSTGISSTGMMQLFASILQDVEERDYE